MHRTDNNRDNPLAKLGPTHHLTPSGPIDIFVAYRKLKRDDLRQRMPEAAHAETPRLRQLGEIGTGMVGSPLRRDRELGLLMLCTAAPSDNYSKFNAAQEYARGGDVPPDPASAESLYRDVVATVPIDHGLLGIAARHALACLLASTGRDNEAQTIWQLIAPYDQDAAYEAARGRERSAQASGASEDLKDAVHLYRLAAIDGHREAMLALARVLTQGDAPTQKAREEARTWGARAQT